MNYLIEIQWPIETLELADILRMFGEESIGVWKKTAVHSLTMIKYEAVMVTGKFSKRVNSTDSTNRSFSEDDVVFCSDTNLIRDFYSCKLFFIFFLIRFKFFIFGSNVFFLFYSLTRFVSRFSTILKINKYYLFSITCIVNHKSF